MFCFVFLELSSFFNDPADVGNLISGSSAFSKTRWNIWKFTVHVLLKPGLESFEHLLAWDECNCAVVWTFFSIAFLWDWTENWLAFSSPVATSEFSKFAGILSAALSQHHLSGFELAQLEFHHFHWLCSYWCFLRPTWLHIPGCLALGEWTHSPWLSGSWRYFLYSSSV